ncbi:MAG: response regulator PleD [Alphaproteobacteria bacterium ADurb.Bin438]|nr:MAG: response regulator PleD [Alphaproteobacteria bacterium ADurb.Bin438]
MSKELFDSIKCLVVCKDKFNRSLIRSVVVNAGIRGTNISEIEDLREISFKGYDLCFNSIIIDHDEYEGFNYMEEIEKNPATNKTPLIILTNSNSKEFVLKAIELGITGIVLKPINTLSVKKNLEKACGFVLAER